MGLTPSLSMLAGPSYRRTFKHSRLSQASIRGGGGGLGVHARSDAKRRGRERKTVGRGTLYLSSGLLWGREVGSAAGTVFATHPSVEGRDVVGSITHVGPWSIFTVDIVLAAEPPPGSVARAADQLWAACLPPVHKTMRYWPTARRDELVETAALALDPTAPILFRVAGVSFHHQAIASAHAASATTALLVSDPSAHDCRGTRVLLNSVGMCGYVPARLRGVVATGEVSVVAITSFGEGQWSVVIRAARA